MTNKVNFSQKILVLTDHRPGTNNQSLALAQEIGLEYEVIEVKHSFLSMLPNFFLNSSWLRLEKNSGEALQNKLQKDGYPDLIISGGRRLAVIAKIIKEQSEFYSRIIQIMKPQLPVTVFDIIILPEHDEFKYRQDKRLIFMIGALNLITKDSLSLAKEQFLTTIGANKKNKIALLLGGKTRGYKFSKSQAVDLAKFINKIAKKEKATILIANSRRTEEKINKILKNNLDCDYQFFDWKDYKSSNRNPYKAILAYSDKLIVSADSISMISECCSTQKPTYVFNCNKMPSKKHQRFLQYMLRNVFVKKLNTNKGYLKEFEPKKLQESKRIASIIKFRYLKNYPID